MKDSSKLILPKNPTLREFQKYVKEMELERGFAHDSVLQKCLLLGEEMGELFKAIRKTEGMKTDSYSYIGEIPEELADIFIYTLAIANKYNIDLEEAFKIKENKNKLRTWN